MAGFPGWMGLQAKDHRWPLEVGKGKEIEAVHLRRDVVMLTSSFWSIETDFRLLTCR